MKHTHLFLLTAMLLLALPASAVDRNQDGINDMDSINASEPQLRDGEFIAIVDAGDSASLLARLQGLGYSPAIIPVDSGFDVLIGYGLVCLPVGHGSLTYNASIAAMADDYHNYVQAGGGLWIGQPNPFQMPNHTTAVSWAPYDLTVEFSYSIEDCPASIVADHCITTGLADTDMPFPGDNAIVYGPEWEVLVTGGVTGLPAVMFATYGAGNILVEFGHPSSSAICSPSDACLERFVTCTVGGVVATTSSSWGGVKSLYR